MKKDMFYVVTGGWNGYDYKELCEIINKKTMDTSENLNLKKKL